MEGLRTQPKKEKLDQSRKKLILFFIRLKEINQTGSIEKAELISEINSFESYLNPQKPTLNEIAVIKIEYLMRRMKSFINELPRTIDESEKIDLDDFINGLQQMPI